MIQHKVMVGQARSHVRNVLLLKKQRGGCISAINTNIIITQYPVNYRVFEDTVTESLTCNTDKHGRLNFRTAGK